MSTAAGLGRKPRVALVGCGWFAKVAHLPAWQQLEAEGQAELVAVCSRNAQARAEVLQRIGRPLAEYDSLAALLADPKVDAVDLVLPTLAMDEAIAAALQAGKHVISEKPAAATVARARALMALQADCDPTLSWTVAENWPFKPTVALLQRIVQLGDPFELGALQRMDFRFKAMGWSEAAAGWRGDPAFRGGFLMDSAVHFVSLLRLLGGGVAELRAEVGWRAPQQVAHQVRAELLYENGARGRFEVSLAETAPDPDPFHLRLVGEQGLLGVNFQSAQVLLQRGAERQLLTVPDDPWVQGGVLPMLRHACEVIRLGGWSRSSPLEGLKDVAVVETLIESSRLARALPPALLVPQLSGAGRPQQAYAGLHPFRPRHSVAARSVADVQTAVREAAAAGLRVRAAGHGHSWSGYLRTEGVSLQLAGLQGLVVDRERQRVRVGAGLRIGELTRRLAAQGLSLPSLPFLTQASVGGMVATASHGTSPHWGTLSDAVLGLTLVNARGELLKFDADHEPLQLRAARVALGLLGPIVELELQAVPMRWVRNVRIDLSLDDFEALRPALFARCEHLWVHWLLGSERLIVQGLESRETAAEGFVPYVSGESPAWLTQYHHAPLPPPRDGLMLSQQYAVPLQQLADTLRRVNALPFAAQHAGREIELKFLRHSEASLLGPNADGDVVLFNSYWPVERAHAGGLFDAYEDLMQSLRARPHWGKHHRPVSVDSLARCHPQWPAFDAVRRALDPGGLFTVFD